MPSIVATLDGAPASGQIVWELYAGCATGAPGDTDTKQSASANVLAYVLTPPATDSLLVGATGHANQNATFLPEDTPVFTERFDGATSSTRDHWQGRINSGTSDVTFQANASQSSRMIGVAAAVAKAAGLTQAYLEGGSGLWTSGSTITASPSAFAAGASRKLFVWVHHETAPARTTQSVTVDGVPMTLIATRVLQTNNEGSLWYLDLDVGASPGVIKPNLLAVPASIKTPTVKPPRQTLIGTTVATVATVLSPAVARVSAVTNLEARYAAHLTLLAGYSGGASTVAYRAELRMARVAIIQARNHTDGDANQSLISAGLIAAAFRLARADIEYLALASNTQRINAATLSAPATVRTPSVSAAANPGSFTHGDQLTTSNVGLAGVGVSESGLTDLGGTVSRSTSGTINNSKMRTISASGAGVVVTLNRCLIDANGASYGVIVSNGATVILNDCTIRRCVTAMNPSGSGSLGGVQVNRCLIHQSTDGLRLRGGGIAATDSYFLIDVARGSGVIPADAHMDPAHGEGGGGFTLTRCRLNANDATVYNSNSATIVKPTFGAIDIGNFINCYFDGGNYHLMIHANDSTGDLASRIKFDGCKFGDTFRFGRRSIDNGITSSPAAQTSNPDLVLWVNNVFSDGSPFPA